MFSQELTQKTVNGSIFLPPPSEPNPSSLEAPNLISRSLEIDPVFVAMQRLIEVPPVILKNANVSRTKCCHEDCTMKVLVLANSCGLCANPPKLTKEEKGYPMREGKKVVICGMHKAEHDKLHKTAGDYAPDKQRRKVIYEPRVRHGLFGNSDGNAY